MRYTMPMLAMFPQILFLAPLAAFVIRLALALLFAYSSWKHASAASSLLRFFALLEIAVAAALVAGASTQLVALVAALLLAASFFRADLAVSTRTATLLALAMCASLFLTGAGAFAVDLPL